jgi:hypothetical protein
MSSELIGAVGRGKAQVWVRREGGCCARGTNQGTIKDLHLILQRGPGK